MERTKKEEISTEEYKKSKTSFLFTSLNEVIKPIFNIKANED